MDDDVLTFADVAALIRDGVLTPATATICQPPSGERQTVTNEHAQHAMQDFCEAVFAAWNQLQDRLARAEQASRIPANRP